MATKTEYRRVTLDDLYRDSSQFRLWSFTPEKLAQRRAETHARAMNQIVESLESFRAKEQHSLTSEELEALEQRAIPLTQEEEAKLLHFYVKKVQMWAKHLNLPTEVVATAVTFYRRFFLDNSLMLQDPEPFVLTSIFLACKSENYFIGIETFAAKSKGNKDVILRNEFKLLEGLKFSLLNHHPYKPLHGFFLDIQATLYGKVDLQYMGKIYDRSRKKITDCLLTDAIFLFTPPQITLAILMQEDQSLIQKYLELKFKRKQEEEPKEGNESKTTDPDPVDYEKIISLIEQCQKYMKADISITKEEATKIAAKSYYCRNPMVLIDKFRKKSSARASEEPPEKKQKTT